MSLFILVKEIYALPGCGNGALQIGGPTSLEMLKKSYALQWMFDENTLNI